MLDNSESRVEDARLVIGVIEEIVIGVVNCVTRGGSIGEVDQLGEVEEAEVVLTVAGAVAAVSVGAGHVVESPVESAVADGGGGVGQVDRLAGVEREVSVGEVGAVVAEGRVALVEGVGVAAASIDDVVSGVSDDRGVVEHGT